MSTGTAALKDKVVGPSDPKEKLKQMLATIQPQMGVAIPETLRKVITPERLTNLLWREIRKNPKILECHPPSIISSLLTAAQLGIEVGVQGQGWILPFYSKAKKRSEAQFIIGYRGLIGLARRSGEVNSIETHIVYEHDEFEMVLGINTNIRHVPKLDGDRGKPRLTYGVAHFKDGGHHFEWMPEVEIMGIKSRSPSAGSSMSPWKSDHASDIDQMRRKTVIRRMANYLPMSIELANAITIADANEAGKQATIEGNFAVVDDEDDEGGGDGGGGGNQQDPATRDQDITDNKPPADKPTPTGTPSTMGRPKPGDPEYTIIDAIADMKGFTDTDKLAEWADVMPDNIKSDDRFSKNYREQLDALKKK